MTVPLLATAPPSPFTPAEEVDLNRWLDQLDAQWEVELLDPKSAASHDLAEKEAAWLTKQEYYRDQFLYVDRL